MIVLRTEKVTKNFGRLSAVLNFDLEVRGKSTLGIIGPNGAGKTTLLNLINGVYRPDRGEIYIKGNAVNGLRIHEIARIGVGRTFQVPRVFKRMSVLQNMLVPVAYFRESKGRLVEKAEKALRFVGLADLKDYLAGKLSGGQQKLLEIARALMSDPELLLLDEPLAGVHYVLKGKIVDLLSKLREKGKTVVVVSHDVQTVLNLCETIVVMNQGEKIAEGRPEEVREDRKVVEAYLGGIKVDRCA